MRHYEDIGPRLKARRMALRLKQREVGERIAISQLGREPNLKEQHNALRSVQRWESKEALPDLRTIEDHICPALETTLLYVLGFEEPASVSFKPPTERLEHLEAALAEIKAMLPKDADLP